MNVPDLTLTIGQLAITPLFWGLYIAFVLSSFSFWRRLKEDYKEEEIFGLTLFIAAVSLALLWLSFFIFNTSRFFLPLVFLGGISAVELWSFRFRVNIWEIFEAMTPVLFYFLFFGGLGQFLFSGNAWDLGFLFVGLLAGTVFEFSRKRYRSFSWYKSGKIGFLFWEGSFIVFFSLSLLAFLRNDDLYLRMFLIAGVLFSGAIIYFRSERSLKADLKNIFSNPKWQK